MGLLDFLKNKPGDNKPTTPAPATPNAPAPAPAAEKPAGGPRYQGSKFVAPPEPVAPVPTFQMPELEPFPFEPENVLEQLLLLASTDENARPAFYQALLQEEILMILAPMEGINEGEVVLTEGQEIQLQILSDGKLPIFSSVPRLTDGGIENGPVSCPASRAASSSLGRSLPAGENGFRTQSWPCTMLKNAWPGRRT